MSLKGNRHPIATRGSRVSRAPSYHTLPAIIKLHSNKSKILKFAIMIRIKNVNCYKFFIGLSYRAKLDRVIFHLAGNCLEDVLDVAYYVQNSKFQ